MVKFYESNVFNTETNIDDNDNLRFVPLYKFLFNFFSRRRARARTWTHHR